MNFRRVVAMKISRFTGRKQWALTDTNVFGEKTRAGAIEATKSKRAIFDATNIDFFQEFQLMN